MEISVLSFGSGSFFQKLPDGQWEPLVQKALDLGINYFDTASAYHFDKQNSPSETRIGQMVTTLVNADIEASYHRVQFDGSNLASGVYYYKLQAGSDADEKKLLLIR